MDNQNPKGEKLTGIVKWYNESKGFGFLEQADGRDLFVHYKEVRGKLNKGDTVEYFLGEASQGPCACKVRVTIPAAPVKDDSDSTE